MEGPMDSKKFTEELQWCITQLELGLQRQSPDSRQAAESIKVLTILKSKKAPLVKKRQVMRNAFGDYRKKIKEAEKKSLSGLRHSRFQPLGVTKTPSASRFLKMSYSKQQNIEHVGGDLDKNLSNLHLQSSLEESMSPASSKASELSAHIFGDLVHHARACPRTESSVRNDQFTHKEKMELSSQGEKMSHSNCNTSGSQVGYNSNHVTNNSISTGHFSSPQTSASSSHEGSAMRNHGSNFRYGHSENTFVFGFENPETCNNEDSKAIVKDDELSGQMTIKHDELPDQINLSADSAKNVANIFKYEKSENDFCFNFG